MSRYVVQSGEMRMTVRADDARKAALWAVHQSLRQVLPLESEGEAAGALSAEQRRRAAGPPVALGRRIRVLRCDGQESHCLETYDVVLEWNQLMVALSRLERRAAAA